MIRKILDKIRSRKIEKESDKYRRLFYETHLARMDLMSVYHDFKSSLVIKGLNPDDHPNSAHYQKTLDILEERMKEYKELCLLNKSLENTIAK